VAKEDCLEWAFVKIMCLLHLACLWPEMSSPTR
jgi:hypothetical protein